MPDILHRQPAPPSGAAFASLFKMRSFLVLAAATAPLAHAVRVVQSNDDGWAEGNLRTFFNVLVAAGHDVVLSGPAENESGKGMWPYVHTHVRLLTDGPVKARAMHRPRSSGARAASTTRVRPEAPRQAPTRRTLVSTTSTRFP